MRRLSTWMLTLGTAACASAAGSGISTAANTGAVPQTTSVSGGAFGTMNIQSNASASGATGWVAVKPDSAFKLLQAAYGDAAIPLTTIMTSEGNLGNSAFKVRRKLGAQPMQKYLDCGVKEGIPNAETYQITLSVLSWVAADAKGGTTITTRIQGVGNDPTHGGGTSTMCLSTGELETRLLKYVQER